MDTPTSTPQPPSLSTKKRAPRLWRLLRAAVFMIRRSSAKKLAPVNVEKGILNKLNAAMRLLHHNFHGAPASAHAENHGAVKLQRRESLHGVFWLPPAPLPLETEEELEEEDNVDNGIAGGGCDDGEYFITSADSESQYSPAVNFVEIDSSASSSSSSSPASRLNAIDLRAEEFIASFYEQIRLQRVDSLNRYNEMIERGS
ncbi:hypothetical protein EJ110_NYTH26576 [Nymphaea thermarum]|nr:hypothetical protein EJ110_NYTH26576 [Nymphaea thermarum]